MTISMRNDKEVQRRLSIMQTDNTGIAKRVLYPRILNDVLPKLNLLFNTCKDIPSGLVKLELGFKSKVHWPRSIYRYSVLREATLHYQSVADIPYTTGPDLLEELFPNHPFRRSERFNWLPELERNKRAMKKGALLPEYGTKEDQIGHARQYVENVLFPANSIEKAYSIFVLHRTQQSDPNSPKVRPVHGLPVSQWYVECMAFDDCLTNTIKANGGVRNSIKLFYCKPEDIADWYKDQSSDVLDIVNADASRYDSTVGAGELADSVRYLASEFEFANLVSDYLVGAKLILAEGDVDRYGGMPSGSKCTNIVDGLTNVWDHLEALKRLGLHKYLRFILVNGDDISFGFATRISKENLDKWSRYSRRELNAEKSVVGEFVWNSKWYMDDKMMTRPFYRVLNSLMFKEHQSNPITGSKEYVAIATAQQLQDVSQHPLAYQIVPLIKKIDKYPIDSFTDVELYQAADAYLDDHNWQIDAGVSSASKLVKQLKSGIYAEV